MHTDTVVTPLLQVLGAVTVTMMIAVITISSSSSKTVVLTSRWMSHKRCWLLSTASANGLHYQCTQCKLLCTITDQRSAEHPSSLLQQSVVLLQRFQSSPLQQQHSSSSSSTSSRTAEPLVACLCISFLEPQLTAAAAYTVSLVMHCHMDAFALFFSSACIFVFSV